MDNVEVLRGPNIKPFPRDFTSCRELLTAGCSLKVGDNITTDHIMPAGAKILPSAFKYPCYFTTTALQYVMRTSRDEQRTWARALIVGGSNYGQGSSREHAALAPLYLGVKAVLVKSFARIHRANLINAGILPLTFVNEADYDKIDQGDELVLADVRKDCFRGLICLSLPL